MYAIRSYYETTLLKILATASIPDSGALNIGGVDALKNAAEVRERLGYVPQGIALMQELSVKDNLYYWMKTKDEAVYETVINIIGLKDAEKKKVAQLSGGMKRRLNIGASLVLRPSVLILDEPLAGVDMANRRRIMTSLAALKKSGMTIVFTSHYIDEMQMLADEMIALKEGTVTVITSYSIHYTKLYDHAPCRFHNGMISLGKRDVSRQKIVYLPDAFEPNAYDFFHLYFSSSIQKSIFSTANRKLTASYNFV